jgi:hypothetical protein
LRAQRFGYLRREYDSSMRVSDGGGVKDEGSDTRVGR